MEASVEAPIEEEPKDVAAREQPEEGSGKEANEKEEAEKQEEDQIATLN